MFVGDRVLEQDRLLGHDADLAAEAADPQVADVVAVDPDRARNRRPRTAASRFIRVVLPQPLGPTRAIVSPCRTVSEMPFEQRRPAGIAEVDVLELDGRDDAGAARAPSGCSTTWGSRSIRAQIRSEAAAARWSFEWTFDSLRIGSEAPASMA